MKLKRRSPVDRGPSLRSGYGWNRAPTAEPDGTRPFTTFRVRSGPSSDGGAQWIEALHFVQGTAGSEVLPSRSGLRGFPGRRGYLAGRVRYKDFLPDKHQGPLTS